MNVTRLREMLTTSWWVVPTAVVSLLTAAALGSITIDRIGPRLPDILEFSASASAARQVLATMASSMLTFTGLTFSITIVVLTLASGQFSPRVLRTFLRDRPSQLALGVFVGTYVFNLVALREVRGGPQDEAFVPGLTITLAFVVTAVSVAVFVYFVHHVAQSVRAATIVDQVGRTGRATIERCFPRSEPGPARAPDGEPRATLASPRAGVIIGVEEEQLVRMARQHDCILRLRHHIGDFVPWDAPLLDVLDGEVPDSAVRQVVRKVTFARERSEREDIAFVIRQLVDIAERALSPGVNDPTTAVQSINQVHDLVRRLASRPFPTGIHTDENGDVRLIQPRQRFEDVLDLAFDELRHWGADSLQVQRRLRAALQDLSTVATSDARLAAIERQRQLLDQRLGQELPEPEWEGARRVGGR